MIEFNMRNMKYDSKSQTVSRKVSMNENFGRGTGPLKPRYKYSERNDSSVDSVIKDDSAFLPESQLNLKKNEGLYDNICFKNSLKTQENISNNKSNQNKISSFFTDSLFDRKKNLKTLSMPSAGELIPETFGIPTTTKNKISTNHWPIIYKNIFSKSGITPREVGLRIKSVLTYDNKIYDGGKQKKSLKNKNYHHYNQKQQIEFEHTQYIPKILSQFNDYDLEYTIDGSAKMKARQKQSFLELLGIDIAEVKKERSASKVKAMSAFSFSNSSNTLAGVKQKRRISVAGEKSSNKNLIGIAATTNNSPKSSNNLLKVGYSTNIVRKFSAKLESNRNLNNLKPIIESEHTSLSNSNKNKLDHLQNTPNKKANSHTNRQFLKLQSRITSANSNNLNQIVQNPDINFNDTNSSINNPGNYANFGKNINPTSSEGSNSNPEFQGNLNLKLKIPNSFNTNHILSPEKKYYIDIINFMASTLEFQFNINNIPQSLTDNQKRLLGENLFIKLLSEKGLHLEDVDNVKHDIKSYEKEFNGAKNLFKHNNCKILNIITYQKNIYAYLCFIF